MANIRARIRGGESAVLEYKSTCPEAHRLARILCAFANGHGGEIAIGVSNRGEALGCDDAEKEIATVRTAAAMVSPEPEITVETVVHEFRDLVMVRVEPTEFPDFARLQDGSRHGTAYVRMLSETRPLDDDIVKEALRLRRRYGGDRSLDADEAKLVNWLWDKGEAKESIASRKFNFSGHRLRRLAEQAIGSGHVIHCRQPSGRTYIAIRPGQSL